MPLTQKKSISNFAYPKENEILRFACSQGLAHFSATIINARTLQQQPTLTEQGFCLLPTTIRQHYGLAV
jgi:hypothetical protein